MTTRVLADDVVALTLDSREQLEGTRSVLRSLTPLTSLGSDEPLRLHVVLSRIAPRSVEIGSYAVTDEERAQIERVRMTLREPADPLRATLTVDHVHLLHAEPSLVRGDFLVLARTRVLDATALHIDCIRIAEAILGDEVMRIAARVIAEESDPERREHHARFFVRLDDLAAARGEALSATEARPAGTQPDLATRVEQLERLASRDRARRSNLAGSLVSLGNCLSDNGRRTEAVEPTERAAELFEALATEDTAYLNDLAIALNNLGACYSEVGRVDEALALTERAVELHEASAADDPDSLNALAAALNNLGIRYREIGRRGDALAPTMRAVEIREVLAADNPAFLNDLASSLNNLGVFSHEVGRPGDALAPTERAVELYDALAADNPAFLNDLAMSLANLGLRHSEIGRSADGLAPTERAVELYEALAADNPAFVFGLASSLNNLGNRYSELGRHTEATFAAGRAVDLLRPIAREFPAVGRPRLAIALRALAAHLRVSGDEDGARAATDESERLTAALLDNA